MNGNNALMPLINIRDAEFLIASGSLPDGVPGDIFARLATIAKKKNLNWWLILQKQH